MSCGEVAIAILAAGAGRRFGGVKQLLPYRGRTLLAHVAGMAASVQSGPVVVVIGAHAETLRAELSGLAVEVVENKDWHKGMGTSVSAAVRALHGRADAVLFLLCDQPEVDAQLLRRIIRTYRAGSRIVACGYGGAVGAPALFDAGYFDELSLLKGEEGARSLLRRYAGKVAVVEFPAGIVDIDTPEDWPEAGR